MGSQRVSEEIHLTDPAYRIKKLRVMLLVHRYAYYVKSAPMISDFQYDILENELKVLVAENPELEHKAAFDQECPTRTVGSSIATDYPLEIAELAERLLITHANFVPES